MPDWLDWTGQTALIVATGPSAAQQPLGWVEGKCRVIAVKSSWRLVPFADVLYGIDKGWWIANSGAREFKGLRVSPSPTVCNVYRTQRVRLKPWARILVGEKGVLGCGLRSGGGHSGFQAVNLAVQFGVKRILLIGFDMTLDNGAHWHKDYRGVSRPDAKRVESWRIEMDECSPQFETIGVDVVNCSSFSRLRNFRRMSLSEALA